MRNCLDLGFWCKSGFNASPVFVNTQVGLDVESEAESTYKSVMTKLPDGQQTLEDCYAAIQDTISEMKGYVNVRPGSLLQ